MERDCEPTVDSLLEFGQVMEFLLQFQDDRNIKAIHESQLASLSFFPIKLNEQSNIYKLP